MTADPLRLLASCRAPQPPAKLREAALARALAAWSDAPPARMHWIDRLWTSRRLRLAWVAAMLLFAALDLVLTPGALPKLSRPGATLDEARTVLRAGLAPPSSGPRPVRSSS